MPPRFGASVWQALHQPLRGCGFAGVQGDRLGGGQGVVVGQPEGGAGGVGQVLLVQHLERRLAEGQLRQHRIGAGAGQARVEQFDDHVGFLDPVDDGFLGHVHVTGEPLDGHGGTRGG
jgi:hypothetical protein